MAEGNDINDSDILSKTTQESGERDTIRFKFTLPSGHKIHSEWLAPDNRKKGLMLWVGAVREAWVADVEDMQAKKRAQAQPPPQAATLQDVEKVAARPIQQAVLAIDSDPCEHAKNQVALLDAEVRHWSNTVLDAETKLKAAQSKLRKWQTIVYSFEAGEKDEQS